MPSLQQLTQLHSVYLLIYSHSRGISCQTTQSSSKLELLSTGFRGLIVYAPQKSGSSSWTARRFSMSHSENVHAETHLKCRGWGWRETSKKGQAMTLHSFRNTLRWSQALSACRRSKPEHLGMSLLLLQCSWVKHKRFACKVDELLNLLLIVMTDI